MSLLLLLICRLVLWVATFVAAFQGQMLLEALRHVGRDLGYMVVATVFIAAATLRQRIDGLVEPQQMHAPASLRAPRGLAQEKSHSVSSWGYRGQSAM